MYVLPLLLSLTQVADIQGVAAFAEGESDGTAVTAIGRLETAPVLLKSGEVPGSVLRAFPDGSVLLSDPLRWLDAHNKPIVVLAHKALGDACQKGVSRYVVAGPTGELLYAADGTTFKLVKLPKAHGQIWAIDCGADKGAWLVAAAPSVAYHVQGTKVLRSVPLPGEGLRAVVSRGAQVFVGELTTGRVWDLAGKTPKVVGQTVNSEVMALHLVDNDKLFVLSVSSNGSAEGKIPTPSPRSRGGGALELIRPRRPQALLWSSDGETPLSLIGAGGEVFVGTDLGFVYGFSTRGTEDGAQLAARGAQRRFGVRDQRAIEGLAVSKAGLFAHGGGLRRTEASGAPHRYRSKILDAGHRANWGSLRTQSKGIQSLRWRFGEDAAGEGWTPWQNKPGGQARYAQVEVHFKPGGHLTRLEQFYSPLNRPPEVVSITVLAAGTRLETKTDSFDNSKSFTLPEIKLEDFVTKPQKAAGPEAPERRGAVRWQRGHRGVIWKAEDPDEDPLRFHLTLYRLDGAGARQRIRQLETDRPHWGLKTSAMASGTYQLEVQAEDTAGARSPRRRSLVIQVDHRAPELRVVELDRNKGKLVLGTKDSDRVLSLTCQSTERSVQLQPSGALADAKMRRFQIPAPLSQLVKRLRSCEAIDPSGNRRTIMLD